MEKNVKTERISILLLGILTVLGLWLFWGKQGHIIVDVGREYLISEQVMNGGVLYKDIFNIYGPLAYQINALFFKIFGNNVMTLYLVGNLVAVGILAAVYAICRQFFDCKYSFFICSFVLGAGVYRGTIFNYVMPYSYAVLYGMLAVSLSLLFLVKYLKNLQSIRNFYLSLLFGGIAFAFKYDFAPYALIFPYIAFFVKKLSSRELLISAACAIMAPIISFSVLSIQGLNAGDIIYNIELFKRIANSPGLIYFYEKMGVYPNADLAFQNLVHFVIGGLAAFFLFKIFKRFWPAKFLSAKTAFFVLLFAGVTFLSCKFHCAYRITFLPMLVVVLFAFKAKEIYKDKAVFVFITASLLISLKTFFHLALSLYGLYYLPFLLISAILILERYYFRANGVTFKRITCFLLACFAISAAIINYNREKVLQYKIKTDKGSIAAASAHSSSKLLTDKLLDTDEEASVVVLPEGHFLNYLSNRRSDEFYNNFIPMYVEAFGEENIIKHYSENMPDYFVINDRDTSQYGKSMFCGDYAQNLCEWIFKNYHVVYKIVGEPNYTVLRKN